MTLADFTNIAVNGVYCLINEKDKKVYIAQGVSILTSLNRNLERLMMNAHECKELQVDFNEGKVDFLVVKKNIPEQIERYLYVEKTKLKYKELGYSIYKQKTLITLKPKIKIPATGPLAFKAVVYLHTQYKDHIVGVFEKTNEATRFIHDYYRPPVHRFHYADNNLTLDYFREYDKDIYTEICMGGK